MKERLKLNQLQTRLLQSALVVAASLLLPWSATAIHQDRTPYRTSCSVTNQVVVT